MSYRVFGGEDCMEWPVLIFLYSVFKPIAFAVVFAISPNHSFREQRNQCKNAFLLNVIKALGHPQNIATPILENWVLCHHPWLPQSKLLAKIAVFVQPTPFRDKAGLNCELENH